MIAFIACCKQKAFIPCRADEMYQSKLFKKTLEYCKKNFEEIYILSALHGVLKLDDVIEPYDKSLNQMNKQQRAMWNLKVLNQMTSKGLLDKKKIFFCGRLYCESFVGEKPLEGLSLGNRLKWLKERLENANRQ